ncbi:hypothetical protein ATY30_26665 [Sinorhizobium americanum]|nr:hypothetical protein ATY30_26665 [Sinorhizobium americanum]
MIRRDVHRYDGIEKSGIAAGFRQRRAHAGNVDQRRATGGVVHEDSIGEKRDFLLARSGMELGHAMPDTLIGTDSHSR